MSTNAIWNHTMLRIKDAARSLPFYERLFGMQLIDRFEYPELKQTHYFLATLPEGMFTAEAGTPAAHTALFSLPYPTLSLLHHHGTESDDTKYDSGNVEPKRGFGHIAFTTEDVYASCEVLEAAGVAFKKKPDEGRMKGLAFALDPDGYWIEIIRRPGMKGYLLNQTMIRAKDPVKTLSFYCDLLNMRCLARKDFSDFSLFFLASLPEGTEFNVSEGKDALQETCNLRGSILEITHNHGTETDDSFSYHNGKTDPRGFGHLAFLVPDVAAKREQLEKAGYTFEESPDEVTVPGTVVVYDPDRYRVELIPFGSDGTPSTK